MFKVDLFGLFKIVFLKQNVLLELKSRGDSDLLKYLDATKNILGRPSEYHGFPKKKKNSRKTHYF